MLYYPPIIQQGDMMSFTDMFKKQSGNPALPAERKSAAVDELLSKSVKFEHEVDGTTSYDTHTLESRLREDGSSVITISAVEHTDPRSGAGFGGGTFAVTGMLTKTYEFNKDKELVAVAVAKDHDVTTHTRVDEGRVKPVSAEIARSAMRDIDKAFAQHISREENRARGGMAQAV